LDDEPMPAWLVVLYVFGAADAVKRLLEALIDLSPSVCESSASIVFVTVTVLSADPEAAVAYAKATVEKLLWRSAMVQCVVMTR
jgi:hypothetical protein